MANMQHLLSFVRTAEHGSFSAAARVLGLTPAGVSKNVARLETDLRIRLFHRTTRHLALTEGGERFLRQIDGPLTSLQSAIRAEVRKTDPQIAVDFELADDLVGSTLRRQQLGMTLMLLFGAVAVVLATVGIYGVIAYATAQRRGEVATRLALGATPSTVFWLVLKQGRTLVIIGAATGLVLAYLAGRLVSARLYEVSASDPYILSGAVVLVVGIALVATMIPAYRASRVDPSRVLRPD